MNSLFLFPAACVVIFVSLLFLSRKRGNFSLFRQTVFQLLFAFFLTLAVSVLNTHLIRNIFHSRKLVFILWLLVLLAMLVLLIRMMTYFVFDFLVVRRQRTKYPRLVKEVVVFILYIIGILLILNYYLNIKITLLLASSAVLTVIIGLAVQDILGNLFSGIMLNFEDSLKLGTWIKINDLEGRIEQFGWRSIKVRTIDQQLIVIPNQGASKADMMIYGSAPQPFAIKIRVGVSYGNRPDEVIAVILHLLDSMDSVLKDPAATVFVSDFADFSVTYEIKFWIDDLGQKNPVSSEVRRKIWYAFRRCHIQIPFPVRDVYIKREAPDRIPGEEIPSALKGNDVLQTLDEPQFQNLLKKMECQRFGKGEVIIREGDSASDFYHILKGEVQVLKENRPLALLHDGDFFGEISLVTGEKTTATIVTTTESEIIRISSPIFRETVSMNTKMARKLSEVITRRQAELKIFHEKIVESDSGILKEKTDNLFRRIVKYFGVKNQ